MRKIIKYVGTWFFNTIVIACFTLMGQLVILIVYEVVGNVRMNRSFNRYRINIEFSQNVILNYLIDMMSDNFRYVPYTFILDHLKNSLIGTIFWSSV